MGWWSATIMGGDTPLDIEAGLLETAGLSVFDYQEEGDELYRSKIESSINDMIYYIENEVSKWGDPDYINIGYQVLGVMIMSSGAKILPGLQKRIITAADDDEWASEGNNERATYIHNFKTAIEQYDTNGGTSVIVDEEGLFDKISEGLANESTE